MSSDPTFDRIRNRFRHGLYSAFGHWLQWTRSGERNRRLFSGSAHGLRILNFHETPGDCFHRFTQVFEIALDFYQPASPHDVDLLMACRWPQPSEDRVLFTFDDGYQSNFRAARWLAERGLQAIFFVVPSFLDRSPRDFLAYHRANGVTAYDFSRDCFSERPRGLSRSQVREMHAMGHRIGGHNYAHRNLAVLRDGASLDYEIGRTLHELGELLDAPCDDFAFAFGHDRHLSNEAARYLQRHCKRVYAAARGLNLPGTVPPKFLTRITVQPERPVPFSVAAMQGGLDHRSRSQLDTLHERFHLTQREVGGGQATTLSK
jgi:hypothetical protein